MLVSLHVKNVALIDETEVFFGNGLNILTGETGAGKSIIIGSVNLALGARADKDIIRTGAEYALVELVFQVTREEQLQAIRAMDIPIEEDGILIIQRKIMLTRSICKICGETVGTKTLKDVAELLIDIHGQHEHQSLLYQKKHLEILDEFCGEEIAMLKAELSENYILYKELKKEWEEASMDEETQKKELSLAEFEADEIEAAQLLEGEDEILETRYRRMANSKRITETISFIYELTGGSSLHNDKSAADCIGRAGKELHGIVHYDEGLKPFQEQIDTIDDLLQVMNRELAGYISDLEFDEQDFKETQERLDTLNHLKSKYGNSLERVQEYGSKQRERVERLQNYSLYREKMQEDLRKKEKAVKGLCQKISHIREKGALSLAKQMIQALEDLNFLDVLFVIEVRREAVAFGGNGYDEVEFMISTNPGEAVRPLGNVASGGELSRIMLAIKTVLAHKDAIDTLIFDEIDAGISGKTAWKVSEKLAMLGKEHQVVCITHLPQIAAMADIHFVIAKKTQNNSTATYIEKMTEEEIIEELSRLLGGVEITDTVKKNAREMKELATNTKQY